MSIKPYKYEKIRKQAKIYRNFYLHFTTFSQSFCSVAVWVNVPLTVFGFEFFTAGFSRQCLHHWPSGAWPLTKLKIKTQTTWEASPRIRVKINSKNPTKIEHLSTRKRLNNKNKIRKSSFNQFKPERPISPTVHRRLTHLDE